MTAGKTGTSSDLRDSWFAGFSGSHLVVVWVGHDGNESTAALTRAARTCEDADDTRLLNPADIALASQPRPTSAGDFAQPHASSAG